MTIPFEPVLNTLKNFIHVETRSQFLTTHSDSLKESFEQALEMEDYDFMSLMGKESDGKFDDILIVYTDDFTQRPIILEVGYPFRLYSLAQLYLDVQPFIPKTEFYKLIETQANEDAMDPSSLFVQFDMNVSTLFGFVRLLDPSKIGRNEPCPCGQPKKFKQCHGAVATS